MGEALVAAMDRSAPQIWKGSLMMTTRGAVSRIALVTLMLASATLPMAAQAAEQPAAASAVTATGKDATRAPTAMGAVAAPAQAASPATFYAGQSPAQWMASKLIGATVVGVDDKAVGAVTDLVLGASGAAEGAVIGVGGFLGVGEKKVAVPFANLDVVRGEDGKVDKIRLALSRDDLEKAPSFATISEQKAKEKAAAPAKPGN